MEILLVNGCDKDYQLGNNTIKKLCDYIHNKNNSYKLTNLYDSSLKPCIGCDCCQSKKPGACIIDDEF